MQRTTIALIDDHRLFRKGIGLLIGTFEGYQVIAEAADGEAFLRKISKKFQPDIVLLDINMPRMDGLQTAEWLGKNFPGIKIIMLSMYEDSERLTALIKAGIQGYLLKDAEPEEVKKALDKVRDGDVYFSPFVTRHLTSVLARPAFPIKLNAREMEFIRLAGTELTYKEIADKMCISLRTVDGYREQLFEKLKVKNRVGMIIYAIKHKLIEL